MRDDRTYLRHILDAIVTIENYIAGQTLEQFLDNKMMIDAVVRELEIIGEAANQISDDLKDNRPDIPWFKMLGYIGQCKREEFVDYGPVLAMMEGAEDNDL
jgi:uncharacterized protein with HEPN domain